MAFTLTSMDKFAISKNTSNNSTGTESCRVTEIEFLNRGKSHSVWTEDTRPYLERVRGGLWVMGEGHRQRPQMNYIEVMSLRAWSSSSLMALYLSFWEYNSSIGIRDGVFDGGETEEGGEEEVEGRDNRCRSEASNPAARRAPVNRVTDRERVTWRQRERKWRENRK